MGLIKVQFREGTSASSACGCLLLIAFINATIGGLCTQYVAEYWGAMIKEDPVDIPFWICMVAGLFLGEVAVPAAIITWLIATFV